MIDINQIPYLFPLKLMKFEQKEEQKVKKMPL